MNPESRIAKQQARDSDQRALETVVTLCPEGITLKEAAMLWDALFYTQAAVAAKHGCARETVNRTVAKYPHAYDALVVAKKEILACLAESCLYSALQSLDAYLRDKPEVKTVKDASLLTQCATQLQRIVEACPDRPARLPPPPPPPGDLARLMQ